MKSKSKMVIITMTTIVLIDDRDFNKIIGGTMNNIPARWSQRDRPTMMFRAESAKGTEKK